MKILADGQLENTEILESKSKMRNKEGNHSMMQNMDLMRELDSVL